MFKNCWVTVLILYKILLFVKKQDLSMAWLNVDYLRSAALQNMTPAWYRFQVSIICVYKNLAYMCSLCRFIWRPRSMQWGLISPFPTKRQWLKIDRNCPTTWWVFWYIYSWKLFIWRKEAVSSWTDITATMLHVGLLFYNELAQLTPVS